jgi:hypothetical protein
MAIKRRHIPTMSRANWPQALLRRPTYRVGGTGLAAEPDHARVVDVTEAVGWLRDRADSAGALLAHRRLTSLFALRARSRPQDGHEPVIVVVDASVVADDDVGRMVDLANGDLGAVVIVAGTHPSITWTLHCVDGTVEVQPLDLALDAVGLPAGLDCLIEEYIPQADPEIDDPDPFEDEPEEIDVVLADHLGGTHTRTIPRLRRAGRRRLGRRAKCSGRFEAPDPREPLTPTELHLAIYLAFHRSGESSDTISTMIWPKGAADRTITNAMTALRRKLGTGPDGQCCFRSARQPVHLLAVASRRYGLGSLRRFAKRAEGRPPDEAVVLLDEALELVEGPPFRAPSGYSWAYSDGTATLITETVIAVARRSAQLHVERGEFAEARLAACRASEVSDVEAKDLLLPHDVPASDSRPQASA